MTLPPGFTALATAAILASPVGGFAQAKAAPLDSAGVRTTLRAFYFNLAHRDWEAIAADVLSAKVLAHRPLPDALVARAPSDRVGAAGCSSDAAALAERATLRRADDWVDVTVPRCAASAADEFRLVRFEGRWRFVYIDLPDDVEVTAAH